MVFFKDWPFVSVPSGRTCLLDPSFLLARSAHCCCLRDSGHYWHHDEALLYSDPHAGLFLDAIYFPERHLRPFPRNGSPFPDITFYLIELAAFFGSAMLLISVLFPLNLPPMYTPQLAAQYTSQPDWYFLWIYQILKMRSSKPQDFPLLFRLSL